MPKFQLGPCPVFGDHFWMMKLEDGRGKICKICFGGSLWEVLENGSKVPYIPKKLFDDIFGI